MSVIPALLLALAASVPSDIAWPVDTRMTHGPVDFVRVKREKPLVIFDPYAVDVLDVDALHGELEIRVHRPEGVLGDHNRLRVIIEVPGWDRILRDVGVQLRTEHSFKRIKVYDLKRLRYVPEEVIEKHTRIYNLERPRAITVSEWIGLLPYDMRDAIREVLAGRWLLKNHTEDWVLRGGNSRLRYGVAWLRYLCIEHGYSFTIAWGAAMDMERAAEKKPTVGTWTPDHQ